MRSAVRRSWLRNEVSPVEAYETTPRMNGSAASVWASVSRTGREEPASSWAGAARVTAKNSLTGLSKRRSSLSWASDASVTRMLPPRTLSNRSVPGARMVAKMPTTTQTKTTAQRHRTSPRARYSLGFSRSLPMPSQSLAAGGQMLDGSRAPRQRAGVRAAPGGIFPSDVTTAPYPYRAAAPGRACRSDYEIGLDLVERQSSGGRGGHRTRCRASGRAHRRGIGRAPSDFGKPDADARPPRAPRGAPATRASGRVYLSGLTDQHHRFGDPSLARSQWAGAQRHGRRGRTARVRAEDGGAGPSGAGAVGSSRHRYQLCGDARQCRRRHRYPMDRSFRHRSGGADRPDVGSVRPGSPRHRFPCPTLDRGRAPERPRPPVGRRARDRARHRAPPLGRLQRRDVPLDPYLRTFRSGRAHCPSALPAPAGFRAGRRGALTALVVVAATDSRGKLRGTNLADRRGTFPSTAS